MKRRRRVKCDEHKPACFNCIRGDRVCLGYETPKANIFTLESSGEEPEWPRRVSDASNVDLPIFQHPKSPFGTPEENQYLQHWILITSPMLSYYGPQGDLFTDIVPRLAWQSPIIKHLVIALSMTHKKFHTGVASATTAFTSRALSHYLAAINLLRGNDVPKIEVIVASMIAWCMESMQNNLPAALTHLAATTRLLKERGKWKLTEQEEDILEKAVTPTTGLAQGLTALMLRSEPHAGEIQPEYRHHIYSTWVESSMSTKEEARAVICDYIERLALAEQPHDIAQLRDSFSMWFATVRRWDQESIRSPDLTALLLLFNTGMAMLPASEVAGYSYSQNPDTIGFVVDGAAKLVVAAQKSEELKKTLRKVLDFVVRFFPGDRNNLRAKHLMLQIDAVE